MLDQVASVGDQDRGQVVVRQHLLDGIGEVIGVPRFERDTCVRAGDQLGESARAGHDQRHAGRQRLQRHDAERFVEGGDRHAARPVQELTKIGVAQIPGEIDDVADAFDVDLGLQFGQITPASGDHAADVRNTPAEFVHGPGEHLEPLLILHPPPRHHEWGPWPKWDTRSVRRPPLLGIDPVGDVHDVLLGELEAGDQLFDDEPRRRDHPVGLEGEPPLDRVDVGRMAERQLAAVADPFGAVHGEHEWHVVSGREGVGGPSELPVVSVDDVGSPSI